MRLQRVLSAVLAAVLLAPVAVWAEVVTVATYNVENWRTHFLGYKLREATLVPDAEANAELIRSLRESNDEDNWEVSKVLLDPAFSPDVVVFQEAAAKEDLEFFNRRWLNNAYATVHVFATNTGRDQHLAIFLKPGFTVVRYAEQYHLDVDPDPASRVAAGADDPRTPPTSRPGAALPEFKLFARGPGFALVRTPGGREMWVGNTHQKSKSGNSVPVAAWRARESKRTHEILLDLKKSAPVVFMGDFNDELGLQEFEAEAGGSAPELIVGPEGSGLALVTRELSEKGDFTFNGYFRARNRTFIDHIVTSADLLPAVTEVKVFRNVWTEAASDHLPVFVRLDLSKLPPTNPTPPTVPTTPATPPATGPAGGNVP